MVALGPDLLSRSPQETARRVGLRLLEEAQLALLRVERNEGSDSLHDFRVALRRFRSLMRAYRPFLKGVIAKKHRHQLRELAGSTNQARDLDVQIAWLTERAPSLEPEAREGAQVLRDRLLAREGSRPDREALRPAFEPLNDALRKALSRFRTRLSALDVSFLAATAGVLSEMGTALRERLFSIHAQEDMEALHQARLAAKRLRYVLEPIAEIEGVGRLVKRAKELQDVLGHLQDTHVLARSISEELERAAVQEAHRLRDLTLGGGDPEPPLDADRPHAALLALLRAQCTRGEQHFRELEAEWLGDRSERFFRDLTAVVERLAAPGPSRRARRRFVLRSVPEEATASPPSVIREGFLPGKRIREAVRAVESGGSGGSGRPRTRYRRRVAAPGRIPIEEPLTRAAFEDLWALTEGRRSERIRYEVHTEGATWIIDSIPERDLVLAEVDAPSDIDLPLWVASRVVREVTGRKKYAPENLTGRRERGARSAPGTPGGPRAEAP